MRGPAYEHAANLYYQLRALPWWALLRRAEVRRQLDHAWDDE